MTTVTVRIPTPLRPYTGGADEVSAEGATVAEALQSLDGSCEGLLERVLTPAGETRHFVNIYLGSDNIKTMETGMQTAVADGDILSIVPAVAGGR